jgi:lipid II:glycine glycyltransferase (peptidoglycan interpeptide bridge formation enzyme)
MEEQKVSVGSVHYMQLPAWSSVKSQFGWTTESIDCASLDTSPIEVYTRSVPSVGKFFYIPGLNAVSVHSADTFTTEIKERYSKKGFALRLELNQLYDDKLVQILEHAGWKQTVRHLQYRHTIQIDLSLSEENIWMSFKSRGRYEVLQAQKFGVKIVHEDPTDDNLQKMYELMQVTSSRNRFYIRDMKFTMSYWRKFRDEGKLKLFFAWHEHDLLSGAIILTNDTLAWYKDGGSVRTKSQMMGSRLLQWEVMKYLKQDGVELYDLGGIPEPDSQQTSSMHGIYVFKTGFSKHTVALMPTIELPLSKRYMLWPRAESNWLRIYNLFAHSLWY